MLAGIYYGAHVWRVNYIDPCQYPGEAASVVTCLMVTRWPGKAEQDPPGNCGLWVFYRRNSSVVGLMLVAPPLASMALRFGPPEYFSLMCMGLTLLIYLASGSVIRALMMAALGVILGCVGQDPETGSSGLFLEFRIIGRHRSGSLCHGAFRRFRGLFKY